MAGITLYIVLVGVLLGAAGAQPMGMASRHPAEGCDGAKHPIVILPGIMASQINGSYNGLVPGAPCIGRKKMHQIWPPSAKDILPTGFACWRYLIGLDYNARTKTFNPNRGVSHAVETGGRAGTRYNLFQSSYANLTSYLAMSLGYREGVDMFGAPYDWRLHLSGLEAAGQMDQLAARVERAVHTNCGKRAIIIGHSMGGLVSVALLHRDPEWTQQYVKGLLTVSAPFGGTTDQAISVRMGAVDWNINEWVKNPVARIRKDLAAHAHDMAQALRAEDLEIAAASPAVTIAAKHVSHRVSRLARALTGGRKARRDHGHGRQRKGSEAAGGGGEVSVAGGLPAPFAGLVKNYISSAFFKVTMGLPGLAMLLPYPSAYGTWRRIVVTRRRTYTASMMRRLMADIGDGVTQAAWPKVQELDTLLAKGRVPGVAAYCMYGHLVDTTLTWAFPNIQENKPSLTSSPLVTTSGDGTVSVQSLKQCYKITPNITELGAFGHLEVLKNKASLAQLREVIREISAEPDGPAADRDHEGRRGESRDEDEEEDEAWRWRQEDEAAAEEDAADEPDASELIQDHSADDAEQRWQRQRQQQEHDGQLWELEVEPREEPEAAGTIIRQHKGSSGWQQAPGTKSLPTARPGEEDEPHKAAAGMPLPRPPSAEASKDAFTGLPWARPGAAGSSPDHDASSSSKARDGEQQQQPPPLEQAHANAPPTPQLPPLVQQQQQQPTTPAPQVPALASRPEAQPHAATPAASAAPELPSLVQQKQQPTTPQPQVPALASRPEAQPHAAAPAKPQQPVTSAAPQFPSLGQQQEQQQQSAAQPPAVPGPADASAVQTLNGRPTAASRRLAEAVSGQVGHHERTSGKGEPGSGAPKALLLPKKVSVLPDDISPLSQYALVGPRRSVALGTRAAHPPHDVHSAECLLAVAAGRQAPPGCV